MVITEVVMIIRGLCGTDVCLQATDVFVFAFYRLVTVCTADTEPIKHLCNLKGHLNIVSQQETLIFLILTRRKIVYFFPQRPIFLRNKNVTTI